MTVGLASQSIPSTTDHDLSEEFRAAMRRLAASVCVITSARDGEWRGMTATAVMSVSMDPPTLAMAVSHSSRLNPLLSEGTGCTVNILGEDQETVAKNFSGGCGDDDRFANACWQTFRSGAPHLEEASATLGCKIVKRVELTTHSLIVAEVVEIFLGAEPRPLMYADRSFTKLISPEASHTI